MGDAAHPDSAGAIEIGTQAQMFIDDHLVERSWNVTRVLHPVRKYAGNPILYPATPADGLSLNLFGTVLRSAKSGTFRMWYQGYGPNDYRALYATSDDGIHWNRPNLGLVEFGGNTDNNLLSLDMALINVIEDCHDPDPGRRFKSLYFAKMGETSASRVCVAFSPDGEEWTPYAGNPVLEGTSDTHTLLGWDERAKRYVAYTRPGIFTVGRGIRVIGRSESDDFVHWSEPEVVLVPDGDDPPGTEFYGMSVFHYEGMYLGLTWVYSAHEEETSVRMDAEVETQLSVSRDGVHWERAGNRKAFIPRGSAGAFDSRGIYTARAPVEMGDELWFYYGGATNFHGDGKRMSNLSIGLGRLRRDGFVSVEAVDGEGWLTTKPFVCPGGRLTINAESTGGYVTVAVLNAEGHHLPGYHRIASALLDGDGLAQPVTWQERVSLDSLTGKVIRLKFYVRDARLYSFRFS